MSHSCYTCYTLLNYVMTFFLLVSLLTPLQHFLILSIAITQTSLNFSSNMHLSSLKSCATLNLVILGLHAALKNFNWLSCHLERIWSCTHSSEHLKNMLSATNHYHAAIIKAKQTYNSSLISSSSSNPRQILKNINILGHRSFLPALPSYNSLNLMSQSFTKFFILVYLSIAFLPLLTFLLYSP